ncbi:GrpB family protein [Serratia marcescens]|uniref:GrpB family protein n=1 Tax=Serratia marcescens TaxID=615 RepID=UPI001652C3EB|nr:GrpB family protein [Serratia marcescens]
MAERRLAGVLTAIHRIGAVLTLVAKPTIDILLAVESPAALDGLNDKMHDMRSTPRRENGIIGRHCCSKRIMHLLQNVNRRSDSWRSEIFCASIRVLLSNTNTRQQKTRRQNPAAYGRLKKEFVQRHEQPAPAWLAVAESR